jgi:hypothetical protein
MADSIVVAGVLAALLRAKIRSWRCRIEEGQLETVRLRVCEDSFCEHKEMDNESGFWKWRIISVARLLEASGVKLFAPWPLVAF